MSEHHVILSSLEPTLGGRNSGDIGQMLQSPGFADLMVNMGRLEAADTDYSMSVSKARQHKAKTKRCDLFVSEILKWDNMRWAFAKLNFSSLTSMTLHDLTRLSPSVPLLYLSTWHSGSVPTSFGLFRGVPFSKLAFLFPHFLPACHCLSPVGNCCNHHKENLKQSKLPETGTALAVLCDSQLV